MILNTRFKQQKRACLLASLVALSNYALAQDDGQSERDRIDEEVIVTARLIEESIQDVPVAITAYDSGTIEARGIENLTELARSTPNFSFEDFNGAIATPVIRGQSQSRLTNPVQNVATFYNGVYIQRGYMVDASLVNIGQVEVLRGPQAAAFGRNAYAGAINFRTKRLGNETSAHFSLSAGEDEFSQMDATFELPFSDVFGVMGGFSSGEFDGAWENNHALADANDPLVRTEGNVGGYEYDTYHLGFTLSPGDKFELTANYMNSDRDIENNPAHVVAGTALNNVNTLNCSSSASPFAPTPSLWCGEFPVDPVVEGGRKDGLVIDPRTGISLESEILSVEAKIQFSDQLALNLIYGYTDGDFEGAGSSGYNSETGYTGPSAPFLGLSGRNLVDTSGNGSIESDSIEARLTWKGDNGLVAYAGAYYSDSDDLTKFALVSVPGQTSGALDPGIELLFPGFAADSLNHREIFSPFAFLEYRFGDFAVSVEGRYTDEEITETNNFAAPATEASEDYSYFTPRLSASYFMTENNSLYLSYAEGVKAGGFNTGGSDPDSFEDPSQATFDEETNWTLELGSRNVMADGRLTLNATAFIIDAEDLQVNTPRIGGAGNVVGNRASAETVGVELELDFQATESLNFYAGLGYVNAEYGDDVIDTSFAGACDDSVCSSTGDISGNQVERAPELTLSAGFGYDGNFTDEIGFYIRANASHQDEMYANAINTAVIGSRTIVDSSVGMTVGNFEAKLSIDNMFDEEYVASAFEIGFLNTYSVNLGARRRAALTLSYGF